MLEQKYITKKQYNKAAKVSLKSMLKPNYHTLYGEIGYMYTYGFYLFFDFAGYSHMAIGAGYI